MGQISFLMDACRHLKAIGLSGATDLAAKADVLGEAGITEVEKAKGISEFIDFARNGRVWAREPGVAPPLKK